MEKKNNIVLHPYTVAVVSTFKKFNDMKEELVADYAKYVAASLQANQRDMYVGAFREEVDAMTEETSAWLASIAAMTVERNLKTMPDRQVI